MITISTATQLSDGDLVSAVTRVVAEGRNRTADLIALLVALETRTVHVEAGYASLFRFCVGRLRLSEEEAFYRIAASRVAARFPAVLERLREGRITLTVVALLRKHLTDKNYLQLLDAAEGRSKREVQVLIASLAPRPDLPVSTRRLPSPRPLGAAVGTPRDLLAVPPPPREDPPKLEPTFMPLCASAEDRPLEAPPILTGLRRDGGAGSASYIALPAAPPVRAAA